MRRMDMEDDEDFDEEAILIESLAEQIHERCYFAKQKQSALTDYDPLIVVAALIFREISNLDLDWTEPSVRKAWCTALDGLQKSGSLDHNPFIPCRFCNQAFEPVVDENLLRLTLDYYETQDLGTVLKIHRCPACGGVLKAIRTKTYTEDMHTPESGTIQDDEQWRQHLLRHADPLL
jgi:ribosomal protein S27AE